MMSSSNKYVDPFEAFKTKRDAVKLQPKLDKANEMTVKNENIPTFQSHRYEKKILEIEKLSVPNLQTFETVRTEETVEKVELLVERAQRIENIETPQVQGFDAGRYQKVADLQPTDIEKAEGLMSHRYQKPEAQKSLTPIEAPKPKGFFKY
ncbi:MAG: hypothetical protein AABZ60_13670 [Planctomycetota bacterium]